MKTNRTCYICQERYYYCQGCAEAQSGKPGYESWRIIAHDENCYKILYILQKHSTGSYSDKEAIKELKTCDLSVLEKATENVKKQVKDIMDKDIVEEPVVTTVYEEKAETDVKKPVTSRKRKIVNENEN